VWSFFELDDRHPDLNALTDLNQQLGDVTRPRRGDFDDRFFCLHRQQRLIDHNVIAFGDVPAHDFGFL
jgi:hypothetical protein